jgi:hypothetical protein
MNREQLFLAGGDLIEKFCSINGLSMPEIQKTAATEWQFGPCAYYRPTYIAICVSKCAVIGTAGRQWSYPGYTVDRTPYGVLAHELGHHVDREMGVIKGAYWSNFSKDMRATTREEQITSYCPNDAEWFAEMFRVFVTNPDMLRILRPRTFDAIHRRFKPVESRAWRDVLQGAPDRTIVAAERKILAAA